MYTISAHEVVDGRRSLIWIMRRHTATTLRGFLDRKSRFVAVTALRAALLGIAATTGWTGFLIVLALLTVRANYAGIRDLVRGRVWESFELTPEGAHRVMGWAIATPHPLDRNTWRLDIVRHPARRGHSAWAAALLPLVHGAVDTYGAALHSVDSSDSPTLLQFGYVWALTPLGSKPLLLRPSSSATVPNAEPGPEALRTAYQAVISRHDDLDALARLSDTILAAAPSVWAEAENWGWNAYVLRRTAPAWVLARAAALCLDRYVESLATGRVENSPEQEPPLDRHLDHLTATLITTSDVLRVAIDHSTAAAAAGGSTPLRWACDLAELELDALALAGLIASGRRRTGVTLGVLDTQSAEVVRQAALDVRNHARAVRRSTWFDGEAVNAWASAIAYDGLELCRHPLASIRLRRAIRRVATNDLRRLTILFPQTYPRAAKSGERFDIGKAWKTFLLAKPGPMNVPSSLAPLSATNVRRIGVIRGAEGMRVKQFRMTLTELVTNFAIIVTIGMLAWVITTVAVHPLMNAGRVINACSQFLLGDDLVKEARAQSVVRGLDLGINSDLLKDGTMGLLAVVITAAVAVAVASPREASIKAWSQDRAWQVFIVAVGYVASVAALVMAYSGLATWGKLQLADRTQAVSATVFALLSAAAAASMSGLQSRLDQWQQQRRVLIAEARLQRAHARLGPAPLPTRLAVDGLRCAAHCMGWILVPLTLLCLMVPRSEMPYSQIALIVGFVIVTNLLPMIAVTTLLVIRWLAVWGLAGRVAVTVGALSGFALILMSIPVGVVLQYGLKSASDLVFLVVVVPTLLFTISLLWARIRSYQIQRRTGRGTFALHIAMRIGWTNLLKATT